MGGGQNCEIRINEDAPVQSWTCPCGKGYWDGVRKLFITGDEVRRGARRKEDYVQHLQECKQCRLKAEADNLVAVCEQMYFLSETGISLQVLQQFASMLFGEGSSITTGVHPEHPEVKGFVVRSSRPPTESDIGFLMTETKKAGHTSSSIVPSAQRQQFETSSYRGFDTAEHETSSYSYPWTPTTQDPQEYEQREYGQQFLPARTSGPFHTSYDQSTSFPSYVLPPSGGQPVASLEYSTPASPYHLASSVGAGYPNVRRHFVDDPGSEVQEPPDTSESLQRIMGQTQRLDIGQSEISHRQPDSETEEPPLRPQSRGQGMSGRRMPGGHKAGKGKERKYRR